MLLDFIVLVPNLGIKIGSFFRNLSRVEEACRECIINVWIFPDPASMMFCLIKCIVTNHFHGISIAFCVSVIKCQAVRRT